MPHSNCNHDHNHDHAPSTDNGADNSNERKILISFFLIFTFMIIEAVGGIISGSLALLADAGHMLTDAVALGLAYAAFRIGRRPPDQKRTFGYMRFEVVAGLINSLTLFAIVAWILVEAAERLVSPQPVLAGPMFIVAIAGMLINIFVLWYLTRGDTDHVNIKGAILHVMGDLLGSVGAIIAAITIYYTNWTPIDPILSVLVSLLILRSAWSLCKRTIHILLEGAPENVTPNNISTHLLNTIDGLENISHIHVWQITSGRSAATLHIQPKLGVELPLITKQVEQALHDTFNIEHATIAIDWTGDITCSLERAPTKIDPHAGHAH